MEIYLYIYFIYFQIWNIKLVCNFQELFCENFYILSPISIRRSFCLLKGFEGHAISVVKIWGWLMWNLGSEDQTVSYRRSLSIHGFCYVLKAGVLDAIPTDAKRWLYPCGYFPRSTALNLPQCPEVTDLFQPQSTPGTVTGKPWGHFGLSSNGLCQRQSVLPLCVLNPLHFLCWCCLHPVLILANAFLNYGNIPPSTLLCRGLGDCYPIFLVHINAFDQQVSSTEHIKKSTSMNLFRRPTLLLSKSHSPRMSHFHKCPVLCVSAHVINLQGILSIMPPPSSTCLDRTFILLNR